MTNPAETSIDIAEARIAWVLDHSGMSLWLKGALRGALEQNPIAVVNDAQLLTHLLRARADALMQERLTAVAKPTVSPTV